MLMKMHFVNVWNKVELFFSLGNRNHTCECVNLNWRLKIVTVLAEYLTASSCHSESLFHHVCIYSVYLVLNKHHILMKWPAPSISRGNSHAADWSQKCLQLTVYYIHLNVFCFGDKHGGANPIRMNRPAPEISAVCEFTLLSCCSTQHLTLNKILIGRQFTI